MADWTPLPNTSVGVGGLPSGTTVTALRDNPVAIAEGASGAPRIQTNAIQDSAVTAAKLATGNSERNWVLERTAAASAGAVGTYAFLGVDNSNQSNTFGQTRAGSSLFPAGIRADNAGFGFNGTRTSGSVGGENSARAGTWRCMGVVRSTVLGNAGFGASLWLRIS